MCWDVPAFDFAITCSITFWFDVAFTFLDFFELSFGANFQHLSTNAACDPLPFVRVEFSSVIFILTPGFSSKNNIFCWTSMVGLDDSCFISFLKWSFFFNFGIFVHVQGCSPRIPWARQFVGLIFTQMYPDVSRWPLIAGVTGSTTTDTAGKQRFQVTTSFEI